MVAVWIDRWLILDNRTLIMVPDKLDTGLCTFSICRGSVPVSRCAHTAWVGLPGVRGIWVKVKNPKAPAVKREAEEG